MIGGNDCGGGGGGSCALLAFVCVTVRTTDVIARTALLVNPLVDDDTPLLFLLPFEVCFVDDDDPSGSISRRTVSLLRCATLVLFSNISGLYKCSFSLLSMLILS